MLGQGDDHPEGWSMFRQMSFFVCLQWQTSSWSDDPINAFWSGYKEYRAEEQMCLQFQDQQKVMSVTKSSTWLHRHWTWSFRLFTWAVYNRLFTWVRFELRSTSLPDSHPAFSRLVNSKDIQLVFILSIHRLRHWHPWIWKAHCLAWWGGMGMLTYSKGVSHHFCLFSWIQLYWLLTFISSQLFSPF